MTKSAVLSCPDCGCEAIQRHGWRFCPECHDELVVDAATWSGADSPAAVWTYTQPAGRARGELKWRRD